MDQDHSIVMLRYVASKLETERSVKVTRFYKISEKSLRNRIINSSR